MKNQTKNRNTKEQKQQKQKQSTLQGKEQQQQPGTRSLMFFDFKTKNKKLDQSESIIFSKCNCTPLCRV